METRQLATFVAVARHGSFSLAAAELGYTQSAVSQHIATLEERAGQRLLERRPVRLTASGERLLAHAEAILLRLDAAETELRHAPAQRHLRIGATALSAGPALASALGRATAADIHTATREDVLRDLAAARVDIALVGGYGASGEPLLLGDPGVFATALIHERPTAIAVAADHPFAGRSAQVPLGDLADAWWIDAPRLAAPLPALKRLAGTPAGFRARTTYDGEDPTLLRELVAARRGLAMLPATVAAQGTSMVRSDDVLVHRVEAAWLRAAPPPGLEALLTGLRG